MAVALMRYNVELQTGHKPTISTIFAYYFHHFFMPDKIFKTFFNQKELLLLEMFPEKMSYKFTLKNRNYYLNSF